MLHFVQHDTSAEATRSIIHPVEIDEQVARAAQDRVRAIRRWIGDEPGIDEAAR